MDFWALVGLHQRFYGPLYGSFTVVLYFKNGMMGYSNVIISINTVAR